MKTNFEKQVKDMESTKNKLQEEGNDLSRQIMKYEVMNKSLEEEKNRVLEQLKEVN